jgi:hypothetical protein
MKNNAIKEMTTERRRHILLWNVQKYANFVMWDIRDDDREVMEDIQRYKQWYRVYRNVKIMLGEPLYTSPCQDIVLNRGDWESY